MWFSPVTAEVKSEEAPEPRSGACGKRSGCPETTAELRSRSSEGEGEPRACLGAGGGGGHEQGQGAAQG